MQDMHSRDSVVRQENKVVIRGSWPVPADRTSVYAIASDFARIPENFPKLARTVVILRSDGNHLTIEAETASSGIFPRCIILMEVELLPERGYRCSTFNRRFETRGQEELLLHDAAGGTRLEYTYTVTVKYKWLCPLFGWLVRVFALSYWKKYYLGPLTVLAQKHQRESLSNNLSEKHSSIAE